MRFIFLFSMLLVCTSLIGGEKLLPNAYPVIKRSKYVVQYDASRRVPAWVYECLKPASLNGKKSRKGIRFVIDKVLSKERRSQNRDYIHSGFDRGHMAPCGDFMTSKKLMRESFLLSNMCPQVPEVNRGIWKRLENTVRTIAETAVRVHVVTGPLFLPNEVREGRRYVLYEVIGDNCVAVPTHCFKAICIEQPSGKREYKVWIIPNSADAVEKTLEYYESTVSELERLSGFQLYGTAG